MSLVALGTIALDDIKTPSGIKRDMLGGSAAHFAMAARLFTKVHLVGVVGEDFPKKHIHFLRKKKIDLTSVCQTCGKTFHWKGEYKKHDLNVALTLATELGVLANFKPHVSKGQHDIPYIFLANIDPDMQMELLEKMRKPQLVGLDSMNLWIKIKKKSLVKLMKRVDLFVANDAEARQLTGEHNLIKATKRLRTMGPQWIVIKKGEHGLLFFCDRFLFSFPAYPLEHVVDPTGAGDTFAGGLMGYLSKIGRTTPQDLKKALLYATTMASFNVQGFGLTKTAQLTLPRVNQRMKKLIQFISV
ncbi:MAG: PfkB family carbohydrate kinase [Candidatus Omnitrophota bacterium]